MWESCYPSVEKMLPVRIDVYWDKGLDSVEIYQSGGLKDMILSLSDKWIETDYVVLTTANNKLKWKCKILSW